MAAQRGPARRAHGHASTSSAWAAWCCAYPDLPADVLAGRPLQRKRICRTFSDCTTAPRNGMVSGCYPLDPFYTERPEAAQLAAVKGKKK